MGKIRPLLALVIVLLLMGGGFLAFRFVQYRTYQEAIRPGVKAGGIDLGGLREEEARRTLEEWVVAPLSKPLRVRYGEETIPLMPADIGFWVDAEGMVREALSLKEESPEDFLEFLLQGPQRMEADLSLRSGFDEGALRAFLAQVAQERDRPLQEARAIPGTLSFYPGQAGRRLNPDLSLPLVAQALTSFDQRQVDLVVEVQEPPKPSLELLRGVAEGRIGEFEGVVGFFVSDLATGERLEIDSQVSYSGMSVVKVTILLETYLHFAGQEPDPQAKEWMHKVMTDPVGSNFWANLLLELIGEGSATQGARLTTEAMGALGLSKTFIRAPYRIETEGAVKGLASPSPRITVRPGGQYTNPDPVIQTSPHDMGALLEMIYFCGYGGGPLLETYPGKITPQGCQEILTILEENPVDLWIVAGLPEGTRVAHKHGYTGGPNEPNDTIADAGLVYSLGGDFVIVIFVYADVDWLGLGAQPLFIDLSQATYNFFNMSP